MKRPHQSAKRKWVLLVAGATVIIGAFSANIAFAGGFLAGIAKAVDPGHADVYEQLDQANGQYGHPVEAAGSWAAQTLLSE